jgi:flagellar hook-associated protein 2
MATSSTSSTTGSTSAAGLNSIGGGALQITGLASGLDTDQIISELMAVKQQPVTALQNQEKGIQARDSALQSLQTALQTVETDAQALEDPSLFDTSQAVTSSNSGVVSATSSSGAGIGGYQVAVTQLANSSQRTFSFASPTSDDTITIDGHAETITAGESLQSFVSQVNGDSSSTVFAAAVDGNVVFSSRQTGDTGSNFIQVSDPQGNLVENTAKAKEGQNAEYSVDGVAGTSASNTVSDAIAGVTLTLNGVTSTSAPVTIDVSPPAPNAANVTSAIQQFVSDYNSAITAVQTQLSTPPSSTDPTVGTLYEDPELSDLLTQMRTAMYQSGSGLPQGMASMLDIGVSTGAASGNATPSQSSLDGDLTVDTSALTAALQSNPNGVQSVLVGWASSFSSLVDNGAGPGGMIDTRVSTDSSQISDLDSQISDMQAALNDQQQQLVAQYAALEATLSSNSSQASWLTGQINALPGSSS